MNRQSVVRDNLVDRYLLGQLDEHESAEFESYFLSCQETLDELETTERLIAGFGASSLGRATETSEASHERQRRRPNLAAIAAALVAAVALGLYMQMRNELGQERARLMSADINIPVITLGATRGAGPARVVELPGQPVRTAFVVELGIGAPATDYSLRLVDEQDAAVWTASGLVPDEFDSVTFSLPPGLLDDGRYRLLVSGGDASLTLPLEVRSGD